MSAQNFRNYMQKLSTPNTASQILSQHWNTGGMWHDSSEAAKAKRKSINKKGLKKGVKILTDFGTKGTIKKINNDWELILEGHRYGINPLSVVKTET